MDDHPDSTIDPRVLLLPQQHRSHADAELLLSGQQYQNWRCTPNPDDFGRDAVRMILYSIGNRANSDAVTTPTSSELGHAVIQNDKTPSSPAYSPPQGVESPLPLSHQPNLAAWDVRSTGAPVHGISNVIESVSQTNDNLHPKPSDNWLWNVDGGDFMQGFDILDHGSQSTYIDQFSHPFMYHEETPQSLPRAAPSEFDDCSSLGLLEQSSVQTQTIQSMPCHEDLRPMEMESCAGPTGGIVIPWPYISPDQTDAIEAESDMPQFKMRRQSEPAISITGDQNTIASATESPSAASEIPVTSFRWRRHSDKLHNRPSVKSGLTIILEKGDGTNNQRQRDKIKGRRSGPLSVKIRENAKRCRQQKTICIRCRKDRQPCDRTPDHPCSRCLDLGLTMAWQQPCTKASFVNIVESGTFNYISQRAINHLTLDKSRRIRINLPEMLDLDQFLGAVDQSRLAFDIRVRQASGSLYVLNLNQCYKYLSAIRLQRTEHKRDLRNFIDHDILKAGDWHTCVDDCSPLQNLMACLSIWGNMPSRASYSYVPRDGTALNVEGARERDMDVEDATDRTVIMMAAQLSSIVCRKLEVDAYSHLQRALNQWSSLGPGEIARFVRELGLVLLTLRWRVSWWTLLGDGGTTPDPKGKEAYACRVNSLCSILYFYFCMMRRKLPTWTPKKDFHGVWSTYPDTSLPVFEDFPGEESVEGFDAWMLRGQQLIVTAGVEGKLAGIGLRNERVTIKTDG